VLQLFVVMTCECPMNLFNNLNPVYSTNICDTIGSVVLSYYK
jgi:hypothetical protein